MNGLHLIADLHACKAPPALMLTADALEALCVEACRRHGLRVVGRVFHQFSHPDGSPAGVTGTVVLAESHLAIHTWPEMAGVTLDVYVCNYSADNSAAARQLLDEMIAVFSPGRHERQEVRRGRV